MPTNSTLSRLWSWRVGETLGLVFGEGAQNVTLPTRPEPPLPPPLVPLQLSEKEDSGVTPLHPSPNVVWLDPLPAGEDDVTNSASSVSSSTLISNRTSLCCWKTSLEGETLSTFCGGDGKDADAEETTTPWEFLFTSIPFCAILIWKARNYMTTMTTYTVFLCWILNLGNKRTYNELNLAITVRLVMNSYQVLQVSIITVIISIIACNHRFLPVPPGASNTSDFKSCK